MDTVQTANRLMFKLGVRIVFISDIKFPTFFLTGILSGMCNNPCLLDKCS